MEMRSQTAVTPVLALRAEYCAIWSSPTEFDECTRYLLKISENPEFQPFLSGMKDLVTKAREFQTCAENIAEGEIQPKSLVVWAEGLKDSAERKELEQAVVRPESKILAANKKRKLLASCGVHTVDRAETGSEKSTSTGATRKAPSSVCTVCPVVESLEATTGHLRPTVMRRPCESPAGDTGGKCPSRSVPGGKISKGPVRSEQRLQAGDENGPTPATANRSERLEKRRRRATKRLIPSTYHGVDDEQKARLTRKNYLSKMPEMPPPAKHVPVSYLNRQERFKEIARANAEFAKRLVRAQTSLSVYSYRS